MKRMIIGLLLIPTMLFCMDECEHKAYVVSLGSNCRGAFFARYYKIRSFALPFDWCLTPYRSLYSLIQHDFKSFFDKEFLVPARQCHDAYILKFLKEMGVYAAATQYSSEWVFNSVSGMLFNHDFSTNTPTVIQKQYASNHAKYMRRIERFYKVMNAGKHIYLIRYLDITKSEACEFCDLIKRKFPHADFTLIVVGSDVEQFGGDWQIPHIKNFAVDPKTLRLYGDEQATLAVVGAPWANIYTMIMNES